MTYSLKKTSKVATANIFLSALLPLFNRLAYNLSGPPETLAKKAEELPALTLLHDFITSLELQKPDTMLIAAARQLAQFSKDSTLILLSLKNHERNMVQAGAKPSTLIIQELLELEKKYHSPRTPLLVTDATQKAGSSSIRTSDKLTLVAATKPDQSEQLILYSSSQSAAKERQLLSYCLQHLGKRLREAHNWQELEKANHSDTLTGLHNRRYFDKIIKKECERADRYHRPTSLIMLDLDYFKKVNDNFGHQTGDLVLERLGKIMLKQVRQCDTPCRYGGEEFAIILPETGLFEAQRIAERIRREIERQNIVAHNNIHLKITASLGVASTENNCTINLITAADQALYQAKANGRNQIETSPDTPQAALEPTISHCFPAPAMLNGGL